MNKKSKTIFLILIAFFLFIIPFYHPGADSGFDGSYSGGSSGGFGGGFSSGSSWGSSYHGSYSSGPADPVTAIITLIVVLIITAIIITSAKKQTLQGPRTSLKNVPPYNLEKFKQYVKDFDETKFQKEAFEIYKNIQIAWMNFDYETLRKNVTDEMYNMYKSQLTTLKVKNQKNVMEDFNLLGFNIIGMEIKEEFVSLTVTMQVECYDYIINKDNKVVRGTKKRKVIYNYTMTFNKGISNKNNKCPNCGAPLENTNSSKCPYCDSIIISKNYDWVLAKKQVLSQRYK